MLADLSTFAPPPTTHFSFCDASLPGCCEEILICLLTVTGWMLPRDTAFTCYLYCYYSTMTTHRRVLALGGGDSKVVGSGNE